MDFERNWFYWRKFTLVVEVYIRPNHDGEERAGTLL